MSRSRTNTMNYVAGGWVGATAQNTAWQVQMSFGDPGGASGEWQRYMTTADARELAAGLVAAADHYDAETERLAGGGA